METEYNQNYLLRVKRQPKKYCGCYVTPTIIQKNIQQDIIVPLRHIDYDIEIVNSLLHITLVQKYFNPTNNILQMQYSFPVDPRSCIYRLTAQFENRKIQGVIKEKNQAKEQYKQALKQGREAAYGQIDDKNSDIINMEIGNVKGGCQVTVTVCLIQELSVSVNTFFEILIPSTISPRYMNQQQVKAKLIKNGNQKLSGKANYTWTFKIDIKTEKKVLFFNSPSHKMVLISQNQNGTETLVAMEKECFPNKDFRFLFTTADFEKPSYVLGRTDNSCTAMLSFIPKFCNLSIDDAYQASLAATPLETDLDDVKGEYLFLLDRSGSMDGNRINKAKEALILFIKSLPNDCYFNVISFGGTHSYMFNQSLKYNEKNLQNSLKHINLMKADMGGTNIQAPLASIFKTKEIQGYPKHIFVLTDGAVSNTNLIIDLVQKNTKYARVHSIGIGNGASKGLIIGCAEKGKGKHIFITDQQNPSQKIIGLLSETLSPVISQVNFKFDHNLVSSVIPNPQSIPYILKDQIINFYVTFKEQLQKQCIFTFQYTDSKNKQLYSSDIHINPQSKSQSYVDKMAHFKLIKNLEKSQKYGKSVQDFMYYVKINDSKSQAIKQSIKHQILSEYTAFVCIGKELLDGQYQQFKAKQIQKITIKQTIPQELQKAVQKSSQLSSGSPRRKMAKFAYQMSNQRSNRGLQKMAQKKEVQPLMFQKEIIKRQMFQKEMIQTQMFQREMLKKQKKRRQIQQQKTISRFEKNMIPASELKMEAKQIKIKKPELMCKEKGPEQIKQIKKIKIEQIIREQKFDGSWDNMLIINDLFPRDLQEISKACKQLRAEIVITYLIALWIQKYHPDKQYALLVKKGLSWVNKMIMMLGMEKDKLQELIRRLRDQRLV